MLFLYNRLPEQCSSFLTGYQSRLTAQKEASNQGLAAAVACRMLATAMLISLLASPQEAKQLCRRYSPACCGMPFLIPCLALPSTHQLHQRCSSACCWQSPAVLISLLLHGNHQLEHTTMTYRKKCATTLRKLRRSLSQALCRAALRRPYVRTLTQPLL